MTIDPLLGDLKEGDVEAAYEVQLINTARSLSLGRRLIGRKIGLTSLAVQEQFGVYEPDFGALFADTCYGDAEPIPARKVPQPRVEGEVAIVLARDLPHRDTTIVELMSAVDFVVPAIEVVALAHQRMADHASSTRSPTTRAQVRSCSATDPCACPMSTCGPARCS